MRLKKILLCPPDFYNISYSINPWMDEKVKIQKSKVKSTYQKLKILYKKLGAEVLEIEPARDLPDMVYTANCGFIKDDIFVPSTFRYRQRRGEAKIAKKYFKNLGFRTFDLPENIYFEGQADLVLNTTAYFLGWGPRTSRNAASYFKKLLNKPIIDLELNNPYFFHLDNSFAMLNDETVIYNPNAFTKDAIGKIKKHFRTAIAVSDRDNSLLACNLVVLEKNIVLNKGISQTFKEKIQELGFKIHEIDMAEYLKGGGSVKCVSFIF